MPELPEVEVTKRGLTPLLLGRTVNQVNIYNPNLRRHQFQLLYT